MTITRFRLLVAAAALAAGVAGAAPAHATIIEFSTVQLDSDTWRYDYSVFNDTLAAPLEEFSVYFDLSLYANLRSALAPDQWDPLVLQPDPALPAEGLYDALVLADGIAPGGSLGGFSIVFDWLGSGTPAAQPFDVLDPLTFAVIEAGTTIPAAMAVPEPTVVSLLLGALAFLALRFRVQRTSRHE